jgi:hypothetical protein
MGFLAPHGDLLKASASTDNQDLQGLNPTSTLPYVRNVVVGIACPVFKLRPNQAAAWEYFFCWSLYRKLSGFVSKKSLSTMCLGFNLHASIVQMSQR